MCFRVVEIIENIIDIDIILEDVGSFNSNFTALTNMLLESIADCLCDEVVYTPEFVAHSSKCSCHYCNNPKLQELHIRVYLHYISACTKFEKKSLDDETCKNAIEQLTTNTNIRYSRCLNGIKKLIEYPDTSVKKTRKKKEKALQVQSNTFAKYTVEAKLFETDTFSCSPVLTDTVEGLIATLTEDNKPLQNASHQIKRLLAQLYCLRQSLYYQNATGKIHKEKRGDNNVNGRKNITIDTGKQKVKRGKRQVAPSRKKVNSNKKGNENENTDGNVDHLVRDAVDELQMDALSLIDSLTHSNVSDLKNVLEMLNPFIDTLIIKSIYQLISIMTSSQNQSLSIDSQLLSHSRTLHQQLLQSTAKKLRWV